MTSEKRTEMVVPRAIAEHVGIPEFHVPEAIRFGIVAEKRPEMVAPRAIWEHFRIPEFRVPRSDTLQNGIRKASRNGRPACDRGAFLDPGISRSHKRYAPE